MADDNERDDSGDSGLSPCISPLGLVAIICSEGEAIELMQRRLDSQLETLHLVLTKADFKLCIGILNYFEKRFPGEQLIVFKCACTLAESEAHLSILEDYLQKVPSEITGYAMREWERARDRVLNPEEKTLVTNQESGATERAEVPPRSEEPPSSAAFGA